MSPAAVIERRLREMLGLRPRLGASAQLERELVRLQRERGLTPVDVVGQLDVAPWLVLRLGGAITVDETYFWRHPEHFSLLQTELRARSAGGMKARPAIWSAGCATGEEPYSMAIAVQRALGPTGLREVDILANDLNETSLQIARSGVYGSWSFREKSAVDLCRTFFRASGCGGRYQLIAPIVESVAFRHCSLKAQLLDLKSGSLDVIFFRNVAIYLCDEALLCIYAELQRVLKEGGVLVLGPADPLPTTPGLVRERHNDVIIHRKCTSPQRAGRRTVGRTPLGSPPATFRAGGLPRAVSAHAAPPRETTPAERVELDAAQHLADRGLMQEALSIVDAQVSRLGVSSERLALRGRIQLARGCAEQCVDDLEQALALDPDQPLVRFYCALALEALRRHAHCRAQLDALLALLGRLGDEDLITDGGCCATVASLRVAARELMRRVE